MGPLTEELRVLEIGDLGTFCGKLLADAGADVIRVEPPEGSRIRRTGPFVDDRPASSGSLQHAYYSSNKRGVTLRPETADGRELWSKLVRTADVVIDSRGPGVLNAIDAGYESFDDYRSLVWCSLTPFGLDGPWRDWLTDDLVSLALGGPMTSTGYDDHELPPIRSEGGHAFAMAGEYATIAILSALLDRERTGEGQSIDVSVHEATAATVEGAFPNWEYLGELVQRQTGRHASPTSTPPWQYQCADGEYVILMGGGVPRDTRVWDDLIAWMREHDAVEDLDDERYKQAIFQGPRRQSPERIHIQEVVGRFVQRLTAEEAYRGGQAIHLPWGKVRRPEENLDDAHWADRGFFWEVEVAGLERTVRVPGAPYRFTRTPLEWRRRAPLLGEHNFELYAGELGYSTESLQTLAGLDVI
ncbi:MAG: CoA transferase [Dehalococcoidia bacterium]|nr:CoA transferase [Dehalococcoidia bacterium]